MWRHEYNMRLQQRLQVHFCLADVLLDSKHGKVRARLVTIHGQDCRLRTGFKRKESESYVLWRDDVNEKRARTGSPIVPGPTASTSHGSTQTPVQLNAVGREMTRSSPLPPLAFGDPGLLKRQLQQMALLQPPTSVSFSPFPEAQTLACHC